MALAAMRVPTIFTAQDKFSAVINTMTKNTRGFAAGMSRLDNRVNSSFNSMSRFSQMAFGLGAGAVFLKAGNDIIEYEKKINSLAAVTGTAIGSMTQQIEALGKETSRSVIDIAGSFEIVGSKMSEYLDNPDALKKITGASILMAEAARMELEPAISSLTGVMNIYQKSAEDAYNVVNKLSAGETIGSVSIAQTADILPQFGAQAVRANVTLEESIALVQILTKSLGVEGVGRGLRNILFDISSTKTWDKNRWKAIKMAGVDFEFVTNNANNLVDRLRELKKLQGTKGGVELFFKRVNSIAANTLFQEFDKGESSFVSFLDKTIKLNDALEKANKNNATFATLWARTKDAFTNYIVVQNETNTGLNVMKGLLGWLKDNMGSVISLVVTMVAIFIAWKTILVLTRVAMFGLNVVMGIAAFRAGAMAIAMRGNAVAIGVYQLATLIATGSTATLGITMASLLLPIAAVVAVLGLLAYAFFKAGDSAEDMVNKQIASIMKGDNAVKKSTSTLQQELQKQLDLRLQHLKKIPAKNGVLTPTEQKYNDIIEKERARLQIDNAKKISNALYNRKVNAQSELAALSNPRGITNFQNSQLAKIKGSQFLTNKGLSFDEIEKLRPEITTPEERRQQLEIIINDKGGMVQETKLNGKTYTGGISPKTSSTTGTR